jgi:hypothetical protein
LVDLDTLRVLLDEGRYVWSDEFQERADCRGFTRGQAKLVIGHGKVVDERRDGKPYPKCTVAAVIVRDVAGVALLDELHVAVAVGPYLVFITGYWKNDRPDRKRRKRP